MKKFRKNSLRAFLADERGATAMEYGLIVALLSVAIITAVFGTGTGIKGVFTTLVTSLQSM